MDLRGGVMLEISTIINLSKAALDWVKSASNKGDKIVEGERAGLLALALAVNETRIYLGHLYRLGGIPHASKGFVAEASQRDYSIEADLSRFWVEASHKTKPYKKEISVTCNVLANFWASPEIWESEYGRNQITELERMTEAFRPYLGGEMRILSPQHLEITGDHEEPAKEDSPIYDNPYENSYSGSAKVIVNIEINGDYNSFSEADKRRIKHVIGEFLELEEGEIRVKRIHSGSIRMQIEIPEEFALELVYAIKSGQFLEHNIIDAEVSPVITSSYHGFALSSDKINALEDVKHQLGFDKSIAKHLPSDYPSFEKFNTEDKTVIISATVNPALVQLMNALAIDTTSLETVSIRLSIDNQEFEKIITDPRVPTTNLKKMRQNLAREIRIQISRALYAFYRDQEIDPIIFKKLTRKIASEVSKILLDKRIKKEKLESTSAVLSGIGT